jgi:hypothetical protein
MVSTENAEWQLQSVGNYSDSGLAKWRGLGQYVVPILLVFYPMVSCLPFHLMERRPKFPG